MITNRIISPFILLTAIFMTFLAHASSRYVDNLDGTITDTSTNLMWMRCAVGQTWTGVACAGTPGKYTWSAANTVTSAYADYNDWRLPTIRELTTITDITHYSPAIDVSTFPDTPSDWFWSGSLVASNSSQAWGVYLEVGNDYWSSRNIAYPLRLVRAGGMNLSFASLLNNARPTVDYVDNGDGTVTHAPTCLTWKRCSEGQSWNGSACAGSASILFWNDANTLTSNFAGHDDWHLPTLEELRSLVDYTKYPGKTINNIWFPNLPDWPSVWSASLVASDSNYAWYVNFNDGRGGWDGRGSGNAVRLVRTGQCAWDLRVVRDGTGGGVVSSNPSGIDCGLDCVEKYDSGTRITLIATPALNSMFAGWSGDGCAGMGDCVVVMNGPQTVYATFEPIKHSLLIVKSGDGAGTVISSPAGIRCGIDCNEDYVQDSSVTLTATPTTRSAFIGWTGDCAGTSTCVVTMNAPRTVTASFAALPLAPKITSAIAGNAQVTLKWLAVNGATSYKIYQGTTAGGESSTPFMTDVTGTSIPVTGLTNGVKHFFKMAAINAVGNSLLSNEVSATPVSPPAAPILTNAVAGDAQVTLTWSAVTGATSYNLYRGTTAGGESTTPIKTGVTGTSITITGLTKGKTYYFKVQAVNAGGTSDLSNEVDATMISVAPVISSAVAGNTQVTLKWSAVIGATSYMIYQGTTAGGESSTPVMTNVTGTSITITGLANDVKYFFRMAAVNAGGVSPLSKEVSATPLLPPATPVLASPSAGNARVTLKWSAVARATSYNVHQGTSAEGESPVKSKVTGTSVAITGLTNGVKYFFKIAAVNSAGVSPLSNEVSARPMLPATPAAPMVTVPIIGNAQVTLKWLAVNGATSYQIYQGTTAGGESPTAIKTGVTATSFTVTGLTNNTEYFFKIAAVNAVGSVSPLSNEVNVTPMAPPAAPVLGDAVASNRQVTLKWAAVTRATSYTIYQGTTAGGEDMTTAVKSNVTDTNVTITGLTNSTKYFFKMVAVNTVGTSELSNEVSATPVAPPMAPPILRDAVAGDAQVTLIWSAVTGATSYNVHQGSTVDGESRVPVKTGVTATSVTITGLTNNKMYYFKISAVNAGGISALSNEVGAMPTSKPDFVVTDLFINPVAPTPNDSIEVSVIVKNQGTAAGWGGYLDIWANRSSVPSCLEDNRWNDVWSDAWADIGTLAVGESTTIKRVLPASNGGAKTLHVLVNSWCEDQLLTDLVTLRELSLTNNKKTLGYIVKPSVPIITNAVPADTQVTLEWLAVTGAASYTIYQGTTSNAEDLTTPVKTNVTGTSTIIDGLINGTTYFFKMTAAVNAESISAPSNENSAMPLVPTVVPAAPTMRIITGDKQVTLKWSAVTGATSYTIYQGTTSNTEDLTTPAKTNITGTSATITGLTNDTPYFFKMTAVNDKGASALSSEVSAIPALFQKNLTVDGKMDILGSGHPDGHPAVAGMLPVFFNIPHSVVTGTVTFENITGGVSYNSIASWPFIEADGGRYPDISGGVFLLSFSSFSGISGIIHNKSNYLVGVFLSDTEPANPVPDSLNFSGVDSFNAIAPALQQAFFIGDGLTGTGTGELQKFIIPPGATRVFLGFFDSMFSDNGGNLNVTVHVTPDESN
ncbi:exported hypothetical protein [Gammaproteobacteria bacterium]